MRSKFKVRSSKLKVRSAHSLYNMENRKTIHRTELTTETIRYRTRFPDELFSQRSLERAEK